MPFSGPSSYLETIDEFIGHWTDVDAALPVLTPLTLTGGYVLASLQADRDALAIRITELTQSINFVEGHRTDRDLQKPPMKERMGQLGHFIHGVISASIYTGQIPRQVNIGSNHGKWIDAMDDFEHLWTTIEASPPAGFVPPLLLNGPYAIAAFTADVLALKTTFTALVQAEQDEDRERDERDELYLQIRARLVQYRRAVPGQFPSDHPLVTSLPSLSPPPGHTPDAVVLAGVWNQISGLADLSWTASVDPDLLHYQVRRSGATPYSTSTELVVATVPAGTLVHSTLDGLPVDGATMGYKAYVVLTTGNQKGSNAVSITRDDGLPPPPGPQRQTQSAREKISRAD